MVRDSGLLACNLIAFKKNYDFIKHGSSQILWGVPR